MYRKVKFYENYKNGKIISEKHFEINSKELYKKPFTSRTLNTLFNFLENKEFEFERKLLDILGENKNSHYLKKLFEIIKSNDFVIENSKIKRVEKYRSVDIKLFKKIKILEQFMTEIEEDPNFSDEEVAEKINEFYSEIKEVKTFYNLKINKKSALYKYLKNHFKKLSTKPLEFPIFLFPFDLAQKNVIENIFTSELNFIQIKNDEYSSNKQNFIANILANIFAQDKTSVLFTDNQEFAKSIKEKFSDYKHSVLLLSQKIDKLEYNNQAKKENSFKTHMSNLRETFYINNILNKYYDFYSTNEPYEKLSELHNSYFKCFTSEKDIKTSEIDSITQEIELSSNEIFSYKLCKFYESINPKLDSKTWINENFSNLKLINGNYDYSNSINLTSNNFPFVILNSNVFNSSEFWENEVQEDFLFDYLLLDISTLLNAKISTLTSLNIAKNIILFSDQNSYIDSNDFEWATSKIEMLFASFFKLKNASVFDLRKNI
ncbi:hypothetical protein [Metamycoplasma hyosynoviae]|uniref:hypothetical protein n=1 Tax=Metamycoplasma hyosynoviae TaxID=29559 RepID=UPI0023595DD8|nr:hypothetical protein [Metamycoplasma hyosynoviae]MDC8914215.1 hypothetical protein [Metamycoplasma hyosynoviae]